MIRTPSPSVSELCFEVVHVMGGFHPKFRAVEGSVEAFHDHFQERGECGSQGVGAED